MAGIREKLPAICLVTMLAASILGGCGKAAETADPSFPSQIKNTGSSAIVVDPYTESYASGHPELISRIKGYNADGKQTEEQDFTHLNDISLVLSSTEGISDGVKYSVASGGTKTKQSSWTYTYQNGRVSQKKVCLYPENSKDSMQTYTIVYTYTDAGERSTEETKVTSDSGVTRTKSVTTYFYNDDGMCTGYSLFNAQDNITQKTEFVNNTNGKPVKEKTYSEDGACIQTIINAYNSDGTISRKEVKDQYGITQSRAEYIYDKNGYLIKSLLYENDEGTLKPSKSYLYFRSEAE